VTETSATGLELQTEGSDTPPTEERRERKSRDRYGRDRRERAPRSGRDTELEDNTSDISAQTAVAETATPTAHDLPPTQATSQPPTPETSPVAAGMPTVQAYSLPVQALQAMAEASGLVWVSSDPEKVAAVQAAIAAEPPMVHVPRERPPLVILDEGPLVLVETRKDLRNLPLPF